MEELPKWVIRNLKQYKNCYVKDCNKYNLDKIKEIFNCDFTVRPVSDGDGYFIELKEEVVNNVI